jgi:hypothetical protein
MNLDQIIGELRAELAAVNEVLAVLDRLARVQGKRRGRPPLLLLQELEAGEAPPKRRRFSEETRKKMAIAQRKRWANNKKAPVKG